MTESSRPKKKRLKAAALRYRRHEDVAPKLLAKGEGKIAEKIIAIARENGIAITRDADLVTILSKLDINKSISQDMFEIVAELLVFVYRLKERWQEEHSPPQNPAAND